MLIGWSYTRFLFLALIRNPTWLPGPIMCSDWSKFKKSSCIMGPGSHVGFPISAKNKNLVYDHPINISAKFDSNLFCGFRKKDEKIEKSEKTKHLGIVRNGKNTVDIEVRLKSGRGTIYDATPMFPKWQTYTLQVIAS
jgi:hypothetical protein